jgi:hypothetical protein
MAGGELAEDAVCPNPSLLSLKIQGIYREIPENIRETRAPRGALYADLLGFLADEQVFRTGNLDFPAGKPPE